MKNIALALIFLAALGALGWVLRPWLMPHIDRMRGAEPVKVRQFNPLR